MMYAACAVLLHGSGAIVVWLNGLVPMAMSLEPFFVHVHCEPLQLIV
jgi:hypothetical protein